MVYFQDNFHTENHKLLIQTVRAMVKAFNELNEIRARDGVPYTQDGWKASIDPVYFSSVVDELDEAVKAITGKSAHCHPELYYEI